MKTNRTNSNLLALGATFAVLMVFGFSGQAFAAAHGPHHSGHNNHGWHNPHVGVGFVVAPRPSGHYEMVTETVMVSPESVQQYWVPPTYRTVLDSCGNPQTIKVSDGYMASRVVPAQYTTVTRQVWVQDSRPSFGIGLGFRF